ncbi:hypothetical protein [Streptomyces zhihengii]|uniref:Phage tail protein n=1 Tax=Streptomyces zhihengii TaxID=1818004 RepID=A0ABS2UUY4_9ACTN|nr:hypothetical protein [Streptomyces zhihengii]MBM9621311.1 hypothetical protein [Streptomyces zhihengii]
MNETTMVRLDDLSGPLRVLRLLAVDFGHLPAPELQVSSIDPDGLRLSFHDDLSAFEQWRAALGIPDAAVSYGEQSAGRTRVLKATVDYAGATVALIGFSGIPAAAMAGGAR